MLCNCVLEQQCTLSKIVLLSRFYLAFNFLLCDCGQYLILKIKSAF